jgi:copper chaperone CopZ
MKLSKTLLTLTLASSLLIGCKDTASSPAMNSSDESSSVEKKEIVAAVKPETASFKIEGMTCAMGCAKTIEKKLAGMEGVQNATVNFDTKEATVNFDATIQTQESLIKTIESAADGKTYKVSNKKTEPKV